MNLHVSGLVCHHKGRGETVLMVQRAAPDRMAHARHRGVTWATRKRDTMVRICRFIVVFLTDYGDLIYMNAPAHYLHKLDAAYHSALRFVTNCKGLSHHCTLYARAGWPSLTLRRLSHWYMFIYKAMLDKLPSYICSLISQRIESSYCMLWFY